MLRLEQIAMRMSSSRLLNSLIYHEKLTEEEIWILYYKDNVNGLRELSHKGLIFFFNVYKKKKQDWLNRSRDKFKMGI